MGIGKFVQRNYSYTWGLVNLSIEITARDGTYQTCPAKLWLRNGNWQIFPAKL